MPFGIYKPGQGYWTRVMTAIGAGMLALAGAVWAAGQFTAFDFGIESTYLQGGVATIVILIAAIFIYWIVGLKKQTVEFFIATEGEMQKVNWSTRREVIGSTWVVIGVSICITIVLFATDLVFSRFFQLINVLER